MNIVGNTKLGVCLLVSTQSGRLCSLQLTTTSSPDLSDFCVAAKVSFPSVFGNKIQLKISISLFQISQPSMLEFASYRSRKPRNAKHKNNSCRVLPR